MTAAAAGDRALVEAATAMRLEDQLGRCGGKEFVALQPQTNSVATRYLAEKLHERLADLNLALDGGGTIKRTVSLGLGLASLRPGETSFDQVLARADLAMYQAKPLGRNRWIEYGN